MATFNLNQPPNPFPQKGQSKFTFDSVSQLTANSYVDKYGNAFVLSQVLEKEPFEQKSSGLFPQNKNGENILIFEWNTDDTFKFDKYTNDFEFDNTEDNQDAPLTERLFLEIAFIGLSRAKNLTINDVNGYSGSIIEYNSTGSYVISMNCSVFTNTKNLVPEKQLVALFEMYEWNNPVGVTNKFLNRAGIYQIIIQDLNMDQDPQGGNIQSFNITALSNYVKIEG